MNFNNYQPKCVITKVTKTTFDDQIETDYLMISDMINKDLKLI